MITKRKVIEIGNILPFVDTPHYCRDDADRVRWLALKMGITGAIHTRDPVTHIAEKDCYRLEVKEVRL